MYFAFFNHELGPDCIVGTADDGPKDKFQCPPNYEYDYQICNCISKVECYSHCQNSKQRNPLSCGECIDGNDLNDLYQHEGLDDKCLPIEIQEDEEDDYDGEVQKINKTLNLYNYYGSVYGIVNIADLNENFKVIVNGLT